MSVYGNVYNPPFSEELTPRPIDPYGIAKYAVEQDLRVAYEQHKLPYTIVRPHNFYGPRMGLSHVIPELLKKVYLSKNKKIDVYSPHHKRNFCYIDDGLDLILSLISKKKSLNNTYNIGNKSKDITIEKLSKIIIYISRKNLKIRKKRDIFNSPLRRWPDISKALRITSYKFKYDLEQGLLKTYEWYKSNIF